MITLTQDERDRFAAWCLQEARSAEEMVEAAKNLDPRTAELVGCRYRAEAMAMLIVGGYLASIETMTIDRP
jgi:hypothetical protein